ncbi:MAG: nuclease [Clostridia bacterium]|nr:nuclease [Clostridia bacterium]
MTDRERRKQELIRRHIDELCLMDDIFMSKFFEDSPECTQFVLRIILGIDDLVVESVQVQYSLQNLHKRSVRLDVLATDSAGTKYNIEVQRDSRGASARRARYNSSLIDADITLPGDSFDELAETYVIFITEKDIFGDRLPLYTINRTIEETGRPFGDGSHILYVNGENRDDTQLGRLMHDFFCPKPEEMVYRELSERARYWKDDGKGANKMSDAVAALYRELYAEDFAEARAQGIAEGVARGKTEGKAEGEAQGKAAGKAERSRVIALNLVKSRKLTTQEIAAVCGLTEAEVMRLSEEIHI